MPGVLSTLPLFPSLYEINTRIWLYELGKRLGRHATLDDIADPSLDELTALGFDCIWFLGVWQTGPAGREVARSNAALRLQFQNHLQDVTDADICGSPYAIQGRTLHRDFGDQEALPRLRERLNQRGLRLFLDFVPNHTALDHPWALEHPEYFIHGSDADLAREPNNYRRVNGARGSAVLAHGRDPYFPSWQDTLQLNYRHAGLRSAMTQELQQVIRQCDGLRFDMAMLLQPEIIQRIWGDRSLPCDGSKPVDAPFWPEALAEARQQQPGCIFIAEVYWDMETILQAQGFDYTYDKRYYDRLHARETMDVRRHLRNNGEYQRKSVRFLENHDEPPAASAFPFKVHQAAAILAYFAPGLRFFQDGQLEGRRERVSIQLRRRAEEKPDPAIRDFYGRLLICLRRDELRSGKWQMLDPQFAWENNPTFERFITFLWQGANGKRLLVTVNYGHTQGQCYLPIPLPDLKGRKVRLHDLMSPAQYERDGTKLTTRGLYLDMPEWGYHVFEMT